MMAAMMEFSKLVTINGFYRNKIPFNASNPYTSGAPAVSHSDDPLYADIPLIYYAKVSGVAMP